MRPFVLAGLDPPRRVAELALPASERPERRAAQKTGRAWRCEQGWQEGGAASGTGQAAAKKAPARQEGHGQEGGRQRQDGAARKPAKKPTAKAKARSTAAPRRSGAKQGRRQDRRQEGAGQEGGQGSEEEGRRGEEGTRQEGAQGQSVMPRLVSPADDSAAPDDVLPHRPPFLLVTEVDGGRARRLGHGASGSSRGGAVLRRPLSRAPHAARRAHGRVAGPARWHRRPARPALRRQAAPVRRDRAGPLSPPGRAG